MEHYLWKRMTLCFDGVGKCNIGGRYRRSTTIGCHTHAESIKVDMVKAEGRMGWSEGGEGRGERGEGGQWTHPVRMQCLGSLIIISV